MGINLPQTKAFELLRRSLWEMNFLTPEDYRSMSAAYQKWQLDTSNRLARIYGDESEPAGRFRSVTDSGSYRSERDTVTAQLASLIDDIKEFEYDDESRQSRLAQISDARDSDRRSVFIVHGHDEAAKHAVARFLERLDLNPVVLSEKTSRGRTIIEKFEEHAEVDFAVVILTPDDKGARKLDAQMYDRARQNVIFEFGFFLGKLGRRKVVALLKGDLEIPSDYSGVVYIDYDNEEGWKLKLAREMKDAGLTFRADRLLESQ